MKLFELISNAGRLSLDTEETYLWVYHPSIGFHYAAGDYAEHSIHFSDIFLKASEDGIMYDEIDRGYFKTFPQNKTIYFMPTGVRPDLSFDDKKVFDKQFPQWNILELSTCQIGFKPTLIVRDIIEEETDKLIYKLTRGYAVVPMSEYARKLQDKIKITLRKNYIVNKVILKDNVLRILTSKEKYRLTLVPEIRYYTCFKNFGFRVIVNKERKLKESVETIKKLGTFLWIYHPDFGLTIKRGGYAQHARLFDRFIADRRKKDYTAPRYDNYIRGYLKVDPAHRTMYIMPTDARRGIPENMKDVFKKDFPKWKIEQFGEMRIDYKPGTLIKSTILDAIKDTVASYKANMDWYTPCIEAISARVYEYIREKLRRRYQVANVKKYKNLSIKVIGSREQYVVKVPNNINSKTTVKNFEVIPLANYEE